MRNFILSALLLASALQTAVGAVEGQWTYIVENGGATITASTATGAVTIPSVLGGYSVKKVGNNWPPIFGSQSTSVTSVTLPSSVTSIGVSAFLSCLSLTSVTIPNSVTSIGISAFNGCTRLTSVTIPNSVTSIGADAFNGCDRLTSVTIPNSVTSIGGAAFSHCTGLTSINVDSGNPNYISDEAGALFNKAQTILIMYPSGKAGLYTIPNSVTSIESQAFFYCTGLTSVTIPNSVTSIGSQAFYYCFGLTSIIIPISVTSIGYQALGGFNDLSSVYLPVRFKTTYTDFGLTASQASFYDIPDPIYLMGQQSVMNAPSSHNLYTATQYNANFTAGENSILNSPNSNGLYTTSQIQNMAVGDLVLTKNVGGTFTLNYDIEQSSDLQNWTLYQALSQTLGGLPADKAFVRIKAK
jgi:BspA type Leucine rich repeat region (6 copies)